MSTGHVHSAYPQPEPKHYEMLAALEREPWFQMARKRPFRLLTTTDCPYVAGSTTDFGEPDWSDWPAIVVDRHGYRKIVAAKLLPGLIEHELVEAILMAHGWGYLDKDKPAHLVASAAENICYAKRGIDPDEAAKVYKPLIKVDAREKLKIIHVALNLRPYLDPTDFDKRLLVHMQACMTGVMDEGGKLPKDAVDYSPATTEDKCGPKGAAEACAYFEVMGPKQCLRVIGAIDKDYWCRLHLDKDDAGEYAEKGN